MSWRDFLNEEEEVILPFLGGRSLHSATRTFRIKGELPQELGWFSWIISGRNVRVKEPQDSQPDLLKFHVKGYLVGDRIVPDNTRVDPEPSQIRNYSEKVYLIEPGLDRFVRICAGRLNAEGKLIYVSEEFPLGPEEEVLNAYLDKLLTVSNIAEVTPALDAAFRMENYQREQAEIRRAELERLRREEEEKRAREARRARLLETLGDGATRREMASECFEDAAKAALIVGGAELLDCRRHIENFEWVVKYRLDNRRFECVCDENLRVIDSGICLTDEITGVSGDTFFTLESLPAVVRQAIREGVLHVYRHV